MGVDEPGEQDRGAQVQDARAGGRPFPPRTHRADAFAADHDLRRPHDPAGLDIHVAGGAEYQSLGVGRRTVRGAREPDDRAAAQEQAGEPMHQGRWMPSFMHQDTVHTLACGGHLGTTGAAQAPPGAAGMARQAPSYAWVHGSPRRCGLRRPAGLPPTPLRRWPRAPSRPFLD